MSGILRKRNEVMVLESLEDFSQGLRVLEKNYILKSPYTHVLKLQCNAHVCLTPNTYSRIPKKQSSPEMRRQEHVVIAQLQ